MEEDQREDDGNDGHRHVKAHLGPVQWDVVLLGNYLHDPLAGQRGQLGGDIQENAQGHADDTQNQPDKLHEVVARYGEEAGQEVGQNHKPAENEGAYDLQKSYRMEFSAQQHGLDGGMTEQELSNWEIAGTIWLST